MVTTFEHIISKYGIKVERNYIIDIPNMGRSQMAELFAELNFTKGAEIGVERGSYSEVLCQANPGLNLFCVDPWSARAYEPGIFGIDEEQKGYDQRYQETIDRLKPYNATIIRKPSLDALSDFEDGFLDFVYIDANHDFPNFINDLHQWSKKVRVGGIVSGHDFALFSYKKRNHVKRALTAYARCYRMVPLFIVGAMEYKKGVLRDKYRSFFWVKDK